LSEPNRRNRQLMAMPSACNSSPLALRKDRNDSVENEKDFAPPIKKYKVDRDFVGEEEPNTDSVPKVEDENEDPFAKLKSSGGTNPKSSYFSC
ncbi:hypothetical protein A2U01_0040977, partial [Trifolium medium]|nr:hypothetical protein [Trifolium medium]